MKCFPLIFVFTLSLLIACGGDSGGGGGGGEVQNEEVPGGSGGTDAPSGGTSNFDVTIDADLSSAERAAVNTGADFLESAQIDGSKIAGFSDIFGGNRSSNVVSYLEQRVNYILSERTSPFSRLILPDDILAERQDFYAANQSVMIWYVDEYFVSQGGVRLEISGTPRHVSSSRIGVIQLGNAFVGSDPVLQAITLVHEARHSDCPNGALLSDIVGFVEFGSSAFADRSCGQLHSDTGFDEFAWGPYAVDYVYSLAIVEACSNCTETQKQLALANANSVQLRAYDINGTQNGAYGRPRMGNSTNVRNDL